MQTYIETRVVLDAKEIEIARMSALFVTELANQLSKTGLCGDEVRACRSVAKMIDSMLDDGGRI